MSWPSPSIPVLVTLILSYTSCLISLARLIYWRLNKTCKPKAPSAFSCYRERHPKRYFWRIFLFVSTTFATTSALAVLTFVHGEPYTTILAAWIISTNLFHEAMISTFTWQPSMRIFNPWHIWSGFGIAWVLLQLGIIFQLLAISSHGLVLGKLSASGYHLYFIWEWINVVAEKNQPMSERKAGLMEKAYLMARIVLTLAAFVFLLPSSTDHGLLATASTFAAYDVFQSASLVPIEFHRSPEVELKLQPQRQLPTSQWRLNEDEDTRDYPFCMPSQETLGPV
ncbi:hypothetical protein FOVG_18738 [Fusarium oxysporum f. sp. pisi HDV247]|uniref:Uncharacterized protein n=1 Tax=Fusarium oxysporum f. sp. pisi HDV247 TaxID=1080344 RepID=W9NAP4_FUSOX|nr:hypothetical protein FOVG_18738 [Fusarium oxysporum f. sp. pisi HDV247]KAG6996705.1 hypothetical protein FocnCong_v015489 [Fusarium oxysporum f. sp. conglutinans]KAI8411489.1 hypothetical protein FOFC_08083 [Fusarium oxysporum]